MTPGARSRHAAAPGGGRAGGAGKGASAAPARPSKKAERSAATRAALKDAVVRCFAERGFLDTTIDHITRASGVSHATFYLYFKDKEEAYREIARETAQGFLDEAAPLLADAASRPLPEVVRRIAERYLDYYDARRVVLRALVFGLNPAFGADAVRSGVVPDSLAAISAFLEAYARERAVEVPFVRFVAAGYSAMWLRVMLQYVHEGEGRRPRRAREEAVEALVRMTAGGARAILEGVGGP